MHVKALPRSERRGFQNGVIQFHRVNRQQCNSLQSFIYSSSKYAHKQSLEKVISRLCRTHSDLFHQSMQAECSSSNNNGLQQEPAALHFHSFIIHTAIYHMLLPTETSPRSHRRGVTACEVICIKPTGRVRGIRCLTQRCGGWSERLSFV